MSLTSVACAKDVVTPVREQQSPRDVAAVIEITFHNIGLPNMSSTALVASSVAELELLRERAASGAEFDLTVPKNTNGGGDATIQLSPLNVGAITVGTTRYIEATYGVRNAQRSDSVAFDTPRQNLTFVAVSTSSTIGDTPVLVFQRQDMLPANPALTRQLLPTSQIVVGGNGVVQPLSPDVLHVLTEAEVASIAVPPAVTNTFPYGFVVRRTGDPTTRTLPASPAPNQFNGNVTFAFRIPVQPNLSDNPTTVSVMMLALDDSETRMTQSLEQQNPLGRAGILQRATSLNASSVRLLPGGNVPGWPSAKSELICSVRTAGPAAAPTAHLVNVGAAFQFLTPSPYSAAGSVVPTNSTIQATFSQPVQGYGHTNFIVRGNQSGHSFRGLAHLHNGAVVTTPPGAFLPGEVLEVVLTSAASCPTPWVGRLRVRPPASSSGILDVRNVSVSGQRSYKVAIGDLNRDGILDIARANERSDNVTILQGDGTGSFTNTGSFPVGTEPVSIATGDLNGDGILDLAVANRRTENVAILLGIGDGSFRAPPFVELLRRPTQLVAGDLNADGILDLVVGSENADQVSILLGNGNGTFQPRAVVSTARDPRAVAIGDVNEDGKLDLVVATSSATTESITPFFGNGDGTFSLGLSIPADRNPVSIALGDLNRDGHLDVVTADNLSARVVVQLGNGDGTFQSDQIFASGARPPDWVAIGDMNGDGILDLVMANETAGVSILVGTGNGNFPTRLDTNVPLIDPFFLTLGDLNRDGILDVALGSDRTDNFAVLLGRP